MTVKVEGMYDGELDLNHRVGPLICLAERYHAVRAIEGAQAALDLEKRRVVLVYDYGGRE